MQILHYFTVFWQVPILFLNQWSVSCSKHFFFFWRWGSAVISARASAHDWFSCESQQSPHCSSSTSECRVGSLERHFCQSLFVPDKDIVSEFFIRYFIAFELNGGEQCFTGQMIHVRSSHSSKKAMFWSLWVPVLTSISYRESEVPTHFLNS